MQRHPGGAEGQAPLDLARTRPGPRPGEPRAPRAREPPASGRRRRGHIPSLLPAVGAHSRNNATLDLRKKRKKVDAQSFEEARRGEGARAEQIRRRGQVGAGRKAAAYYGFLHLLSAERA